MIKLDDQESYYNFPYRPDVGEQASDSATPNIGGLDLIAHPEKIDDIPEAKLSPILKKLLVDLNRPDSPYMTLGCAYWIYRDNSETSYAYLEFSFRSIDTANNKAFSLYLDEKFLDYLVQNKSTLAEEFGVPAEAIPTAANYCGWRYRPFSYFESEPRILIYFQVGSPQHQDLEIFLDLLHRFLTEYLVVPS